jgi:hypothetical protein
MEEEFPSERFRSSADLLKRLQEGSDDFDSVTIMVSNDMPMQNAEGRVEVAADCCSMIHTCNGGSFLIHREELEALLNDGILQRMKIPIKLLPREAR